MNLETYATQHLRSYNHTHAHSHEHTLTHSLVSSISLFIVGMRTELSDSNYQWHAAYLLGQKAKYVFLFDFRSISLRNVYNRVVPGASEITTLVLSIRVAAISLESPIGNSKRLLLAVKPETLVSVFRMATVRRCLCLLSLRVEYDYGPLLLYDLSTAETSIDTSLSL